MVLSTILQGMYLSTGQNSAKSQALERQYFSFLTNIQLHTTPHTHKSNVTNRSDYTLLWIRQSMISVDNKISPIVITFQAEISRQSTHF